MHSDRGAWGLSDGRFLVLYAGMLVLGTGLCVLTRALVLRMPEWRLHRQGPAGGALHPVDLAFLVSGPEHAAVVAFLGLWQRGAIRPQGGSSVASSLDMPVTRAELADLTVPWDVVEGASASEHPVEEAVVKAVRQAGEPSAQSPEDRQEEAISDLLRGLRRRLHPRIEIQQRLLSRGLIVDSATERGVYLAALWPLLVLGIGIARVIVDAGDNPVALLPLLLTAGVILLAALRAPRLTPLGRRVVAQAGEPSLAVAKQVAEQMKSVHPYGTDEPELQRIGADPVAAAAHGPSLVWGAAPVLPASFGFLPPRPEHLRGAAAPLRWDAHHLNWWIAAGPSGGSLTGWGTLAGWGGTGGDSGDGDHGVGNN